MGVAQHDDGKIFGDCQTQLAQHGQQGLALIIHFHQGGADALVQPGLHPLWVNRVCHNTLDSVGNFRQAALLAAKVGTTRLIDNWKMETP